MNTFAHLSIDVLTDLAHETSPVNAQAQAHLGDCQQCANTLAQLRHVIGVMRSDRTEEVPSHVIQRAERLLRQRRPIPTPERQPSLPQRILAVLRFDSFQQPAFGLRSGKPIARQLLFSAGDSDIDLRIAPSNGDWQITGQVLGPTAGGQATLIGSQIEHTVTFNELNRFQLPAVAAGLYTLRLHLGGTEVDITDLSLGE
jgi:hypothetical protein